jgi:hypothetical protein
MSFRSVDSPQFRRLLYMLKPNVEIPSASALVSALKLQASEVRNDLLQGLGPDTKISLALDAWSSPNHLAFLGIVVYFIDMSWNYRERLIGFELLSGEHSGENLSEVVYAVLERYGIQDRLLAITTDNASNNTTLIPHLEGKLESSVQDMVFSAESCHIPCLAHVVQLVVRSFMDGIKVIASNEQLISHFNEEADLEGVRQSAQGFQRTLLKVSF